MYDSNNNIKRHIAYGNCFVGHCPAYLHHSAYQKTDRQHMSYGPFHKGKSEVNLFYDDAEDGIVDGIGDTVGQVVDAMRGNQSSIAAATHIIDAGSSLLGILKKKKSGDESETKKAKQKKKK